MWPLEDSLKACMKMWVEYLAHVQLSLHVGPPTTGEGAIPKAVAYLLNLFPKWVALSGPVGEDVPYLAGTWYAKVEGY